MAAHLLSQQVNATRHFWYRLRVRALDRFVARGATILDVGAGAGSLGAILEATRPDVAYLYQEPDPVLRAHLVDRFGAGREHRAGDALGAPACAALLDVIEHVDDDAALLRSVAADLAPGAKVIVTVPALRLLWSSWDVNLGHRRRYRRRDLRDTLTRAGLDVVEVRYLFPELVPVGLLRRVAPGKAGTEDFPPIPAPLNALLYALGGLTQRLGRATPFGSSVMAVGVVPATS